MQHAKSRIRRFVSWCGLIAIFLVSAYIAWLTYPGRTGVDVRSVDETEVERANMESATEKTIAKAVAALAEEGFGVVHLGTPWPMISKNVEFIIASKNRSIPHLCAALESDNYVLLGYAAFCLEQIGASEGTGLARARHEKLMRVREDANTFGFYFALRCLSEYIESQAPRETK